MLPLSHLPHIDSRLAGALQGEGKLVKEGSSDQFRVQESGDVGMGSADKTDSYYSTTQDWGGFLSSHQIPLRGPVYFSVGLKKNEETKLYFLWSEMIRPVAKLIFFNLLGRKIDLALGVVES